MKGEFTYQDFDLLIEPGPDGGYRARVLRSPAGESAPVQFMLPFSPVELENFVLKVGRGRRRTRGPGRPESAPLKDFGGKLYGAVFQEELRDALQRSLSLTRAWGVGMRLRLRLADTPELAELPWEFLYDPRRDRFLAQSRRTPLVRYLDLPDPPRPLAVEGPLRLLVMISSPSDYAELDVEREWSLLTGALAQQQAEGRVVIERLSASMKELRQRLRREEFHVFHFVGHGRYRPDWGKGVLVMEDRHGRSQEVLGDELGSLLNDYDQTRLAVLNACEGARSDDASDPFAGVAQSLIQQGLPAVIAMQFEITDDAAIIFAQELYGAIADGYPLEAALAEARGAILDEGNQTEWGTPVLYSRAPDGRLFEVTGQDRISEANREAREVAEQKAREEAEQKAREEAEQKAREEAEQKASEEAARKSRERRARLKAEQKAREEADRKAREEAEQKARQETVRRRPTSVQAKSEPKPPKAPAPKPPIDVPPERMGLRLVLRDLDNMGFTGQLVACIPPPGRQVKVDRLMVKDGDVVAKGQPLLVVRTAETRNERPTVLTSPWPSRIQFLVRAGEKLSADSHIAALDIDVAYALTKPGTTEYRVDLDGAITVLTIDEIRGRRLRVIPTGAATFPMELHRYITSHEGSRYGQAVGLGEISQVTPITLLHPLGAVHASMKLGSSRDSLMLGTDSLSFDTTGIVRGVKFYGSGHAKLMQALADRNR